VHAVKVEWQLFVATFAARVCGQKKLGVANNGKKVTPWWKQVVKVDIRADKVLSRTFFPFAVR